MAELTDRAELCQPRGAFGIIDLMILTTCLGIAAAARMGITNASSVTIGARMPMDTHELSARMCALSLALLVTNVSGLVVVGAGRRVVIRAAVHATSAQAVLFALATLVPATIGVPLMLTGALFVVPVILGLLHPIELAPCTLAQAVSGVLFTMVMLPMADFVLGYLLKW